MTLCNVCGAALASPVYQTASGITSLAKINENPTRVSFCASCGHLQTDAIVGVEDYYAKDYRLMVDSAEEDQIYEVVNGKIVYRYDHQAETLLRILDLPSAARILDYGCAKGTTLCKVWERRRDIAIHLFEVSDAYIPFWRTFSASDHWSTGSPPAHWREYFDVVTSFFVLEHVPDPQAYLALVSGLLKPGGTFYFIVPNVLSNPADFVVVDHANHFTKESLKRLVSGAGLELTSINDTAHAAAFVITAKKRSGRFHTVSDSDEIQKLGDGVKGLARYWQEIGDAIRHFEETQANRRPVAIYGSGFYGTFIASSLRDRSNVQCFIDQNPYLKGKMLFGRPIISPDQLDSLVNVIYVGLRPEIATRDIQAIEAWRDRNHEYFFL